MIAKSKKEIKLNIGCGVGLLPDFINVDKHFTLKDLKSKKGAYANATIGKNAKFVKADILKLPFKKNYADYIICIDVIEHIRMRQVIPAMKELYRVLKPGGRMLLMTTDFNDLIDYWNEIRRKKFDLASYLEVAEIIYGNQAGVEEGELHKSAFTSDFLNLCLQSGGFAKYTLSGYARGSGHPPLDGYFDYATGQVLRSSMFVVEATK